MKKKDVEKKIKPKKEKVEKVKKVKEPKEQKVSKISSDAKIIFGIVGGMVLICAALIFYYFYGVNNQVVATYKGGKVTRGEYETYYKLFGSMLTYYGYDEEAIKEEVLNKAVIDKIVLEKAEKDGVKLSDEAKADIEETFKDEEQINQFADQGLDPEKMKQVYYDDALITEYIDKLTKEATEEQIKAFIDDNEGEKANYNKYVCSYILYANTDENAETNAKATLDRIKNGEGFAAVGEEVQAADANNIQYGSEFELYLNGSTVSAFEDAVRGMTVGQTTEELVNSKEYGYFIIRLESVIENDRINGEEAASNYVNELLSKWQKDAKIEGKDAKINKIVATLTNA